MKATIKPFYYLILSTALWGGTFPAIRSAVTIIDPAVFVTVRFIIAALLLLPFISKQLNQTNWRIVGAGFLLALFGSGVYLFQSIGLQTISSSRSAFLTNTSVVIVPFLLAGLRMGRLQALDVVTAGLCLLGLYLLTGAKLTGFHQGDIWTLACALSWALTIITVQWITQYTKAYLLLTFYQILLTAPIVGIFSIGHSFHHLFNITVISALAYCVIFATVWALLLQLKYQHYVTPAKAALIFCLEPVFATLLAVLFFHERVSLDTIYGGSLILLSIMLPDLLRVLRRAVQ